MKRVISALLVLCMAAGLFGCKKTEEQTVDPNAIAKVVTGSNTQYVLSVEDLQKAIDPSGNTQVTLLKDISHKTAITLPYSCTIDLGGHTVETNPKMGIGLSVEAAGTENPTTTLKNGTVRSYADGIRVKAGAVVISEVCMYTAYGFCVSLYDPQAAYLDINKIENSTLASAAYGCLAFNGTDVDYSGTGITITNTDLIAYSAEGAMVFRKGGGNTVAGLVNLGEGTAVYSYADILAPANMYFNGSGMAKTAGAEVTVDGTTITGINKWTEDTENVVLDVLMVGNSFCWYFTEELHGVANAAGIQLNINNLYEAGCYVQEHWDWLQADSQSYEQYWITNDFGRFKHPENLKLSSALAYDDWDVITLQQHFGSGVKDYDAALAKCTPYTKNLYDHFKATNPDAKLYWQTTWAYQVGHESMPSTADQKLRQNNIIAVSQTLAEESGVDVIPSGQAWAIARANPKVGDNMCKSDMLHDGDVGGGQYLNACVWFEVLTGKSCIGNTWRPDTYRLSEEKVVELQKAAHQAVAEMYGEDYAK